MHQVSANFNDGYDLNTEFQFWWILENENILESLTVIFVNRSLNGFFWINIEKSEKSILMTSYLTFVDMFFPIQ